MYRTILVPLDGSPLAERALPYAQGLAASVGARLLLVRAALPRGFPVQGCADGEAQVTREAEQYLSSVADRLDTPGVVEAAVFSDPAAEAIVEESRLRCVDLVVMATHGRSGLGRWVCGSVVEAVLASSPVPVLLVRAWQDEQRPEALAHEPRVLVPLDGSSFAEEALPVAERLVRNVGGRLVLLQVLRPPDGILASPGRLVPSPADPTAGLRVDQAVDDLKARAYEYLHQVADRWAIEPSESQIEVRLGEPAQAIVAASRERGAALVAMATHGRTGLSRLLLGSVAGDVVRHGNLPLLLVRPARVREAAREGGLPSALARPGLEQVSAMSLRQPY